jgi:hypothetical protein
VWPARKPRRNALDHPGERARSLHPANPGLAGCTRELPCVLGMRFQSTSRLIAAKVVAGILARVGAVGFHCIADYLDDVLFA